ncbi:hypothetical protein VOLCADRAFT_87916 [Volvox carteri f. nagariensis]|uniref:Uncharacterized protein n=1 Tax=Volvox carteri f. nagariensis TaxID=3068 RepID=D8TMK7_VOLCA|nr:uncharacterized protein VOLCADRAFT_87916 [Volvox carteri f. nagariensis]EFJ51273.1 hypothetical protein VOLCADRAFT_87916 [Volvox carteri f. nagariensis]|eukprot:XP_002947740.1 hypothetical protein VOLCADRAFT_87916 [Volvox carteri f. nagariensis]
MILRVLLAAAFVLAVSSNALHDLLLEKIQHFSAAKDLKFQLNFVSEESRKLLERHTAAQDITDSVNLLRRLRNANQQSTSIYELLRNLEILDNLAESHPIVAILCRRAYLASIILRWMALGQKPLEDELQQELATTASEFYRIHVRSVIRRGLLEYLHISKSGGTSFSAAASGRTTALTGGRTRAKAVAGGLLI